MIWWQVYLVWVWVWAAIALWKLKLGKIFLFRVGVTRHPERLCLKNVCLLLNQSLSETTAKSCKLPTLWVFEYLENGISSSITMVQEKVHIDKMLKTLWAAVMTWLKRDAVIGAIWSAHYQLMCH